MAQEKVTINPCQGWGCHEHCLLETHSADGKIVRTQRLNLPGTAGEQKHNGICMKGVVSGRVPYSDQRILHPLKRVGERGEGKFEQISWDQALDEISAKINESTKKYGPQSVIINRFYCGYPGATTGLYFNAAYRFAHAFDASILEYQAVDYGSVIAATVDFGNYIIAPIDSIHNSNNMIIIWGGNPLGFTRQGVTTRALLDAKERGVKIVHISNMFDTTSAFADEWVPVRSGTDGALAMGMAHVMMEEGLVDEEFLIAKTSAAYLVRQDTGKYLRESDVKPDGSDKRFYLAGEDGTIVEADHPEGKPFEGFGNASTPGAPGATGEFAGFGDGKPIIRATMEVAGIPCKTAFTMLEEHLAGWTVERAEEVTGVPAQTVQHLAREYATTKPTTLYVYLGLRYTNATQSCRAIISLSHLTGNTGVKGGSIIYQGGWADNLFSALDFSSLSFPEDYQGTGKTVTLLEVLSSFQNPEEQQIKVWLNFMGNPLLNWPNKDLWRNRILPNLDLFVDWEIRMTDTSRYADYVLPDATAYERYDIMCSPQNCAVLCEPAIEPEGEAKDAVWIFNELAKRIGVGDKFTKTAEELCRELCDAGITDKGIRGEKIDPETGEISYEVITYDWLKEDKVISLDVRGQNDSDILGTDVRFTDTGRIELYNEVLTEVGSPMPNRDLALIESDELERHPLQFFPARHKFFMQGQFTNIKEAENLAVGQFGVALNPAEAAERGLREGDDVEVYNDRGTIRSKLQLRDDIPVGMLQTWYSFDETYYEGTDTPQDLAQPIGVLETDFFKFWGNYTYQKEMNVFGIPQTMVSGAGRTTPETIWDALCNIRKVG